MSMTREFRNELRMASLADRIRLEREGVPSVIVRSLILELSVKSADFQRMIRIPKATFTKKMQGESLISGTQGQSVLGILELINCVEDLISTEPNNCDIEKFELEKWVGNWVFRPQPALGGMMPAEYMDTPSGRDSVMRVVGSIQSGAYQ